MEIARVDLCGVEPGGPAWEDARAAVTAFMVAHGVVVVAHDTLGAELRRALFGRALPELFALPLEVKKRTVSTGYFSQLGMALESLRVGKPTDEASVREFADLLWPEGNPEFCATLVPFAKKMLKLEEMVQMLVLEGLGVRGEGIAAHFGLLCHNSRISHYGVPLDTETSMSVRPHYDDGMITTIVQHQVERLEVHVGDGRRVPVPPEPGTFTFVAGEQFRVATNGWVPACFHRVRTPSNRERYWCCSASKRRTAWRCTRWPTSLVDAEHPLAFNPLRHEEYFKWRYSDEGGRKFKDPLKEYCGVRKEDGTTAVA